MISQTNGQAVTAATGAGPRHFLDLKDLSGAELRAMLDASAAMKARRRKG